MKKSQIRKLDQLWRERIRERDKWCQVCGTTSKQLHCHHVIGRKNRQLRWDLNNGILLCAGCHKFSIKSAHEDSQWFNEWFRTNYPTRDKYLHVRKRPENIKKLFYDEVLDELE